MTREEWLGEALGNCISWTADDCFGLLEALGSLPGEDWEFEVETGPNPYQPEVGRLRVLRIDSEPSDDQVIGVEILYLTAIPQTVSVGRDRVRVVDAARTALASVGLMGVSTGLGAAVVEARSASDDGCAALDGLVRRWASEHPKPTADQVVSLVKELAGQPVTAPLLSDQLQVGLSHGTLLVARVLVDEDGPTEYGVEIAFESRGSAAVTDEDASWSATRMRGSEPSRLARRLATDLELTSVRLL